jgi:hypothetical protein
VLKTIIGAIASLALLSTPALAQEVHYVNLRYLCSGYLFAYDEICAEYSPRGNEFRYLIISVDGEDITLSTTIEENSIVLIIRIPGEPVNLAEIDLDGELIHESSPGVYDAMDRYFADQFLRLLRSYE